MELSGASSYRGGSIRSPEGQRGVQVLGLVTAEWLRQSVSKSCSSFLTLASNTSFLSLSPSLSLTQVNVERRLFSFRFGDPQARMNWVHVDNLVQAHALAAEALALQRSCVAVSHGQLTTDRQT